MCTNSYFSDQLQSPSVQNLTLQGQSSTASLSCAFYSIHRHVFPCPREKILPLSLALKPCDYFRCHITTTVSPPILTKLLFISFSVWTSAQPLCMVTNNKCEGFKAHSLYPFKRHKYLINDTFSVVPFYFQFQTLCVLHTWILVNTLKT